MPPTFENILHDGEQKGYFRLLKDGAKIEYLPSGHKENLNDPEEKVRTEYYYDLIEKYKYPALRLALEVEMLDRTPERYADIVIYEDDAKHKPYIVVECKQDGISDAEFEQATTYYIVSVNGSGNNFIYQQDIGGQIPASNSLAPNLAFRFGLTPVEEFPSYFIRVWPGGQGHHVVPRVSSELPKQAAASPCPPDVWNSAS